MAGLYNGKSDFGAVGRVLRDAFWTTILIGLSFSLALFFGAHTIYSWYLPADLIPMGVPFLRIKAMSVFFMFISFAFVGFLRGIKNTTCNYEVVCVRISYFLDCRLLLNFRSLRLSCNGALRLSNSFNCAICVHVDRCVLLCDVQRQKSQIRVAALFNFQ